LYVYKPNVFFAILLGAGLVGVFHILWGRKKFILFTLLLIFSGVMIFSNGYSIQHKMHRLRDNGLLTKRLVGEIKRQMPELASRKILAVNRSPGPAPLYSIYYMEGVYVLGGGKVFEYLYGQKLEEFRYYKFEELDRGLQEIPGRKVVVLFRRNHIHLAVVDGDKNPFTFMAPCPKRGTEARILAWKSALSSNISFEQMFKKCWKIKKFFSFIKNGRYNKQG